MNKKILALGAIAGFCIPAQSAVAASISGQGVVPLVGGPGLCYLLPAKTLAKADAYTHGLDVYIKGGTDQYGVQLDAWPYLFGGGRKYSIGGQTSLPRVYYGGALFGQSVNNISSHPVAVCPW